MTTMPGAGTASAVTFPGELGPFKSCKGREELIAVCGLNPVNKQSVTSINSSRLSKAGSAVVRRFLYINSKTALPRIPVLQDLYNRLLARGKTKMQARCAVMRKMLLILLGMVKNDKTYNEMQKNPRKMKKGLTLSKPSSTALIFRCRYEKLWDICAVNRRKSANAFNFFKAELDLKLFLCYIIIMYIRNRWSIPEEKRMEK